MLGWYLAGRVEDGGFNQTVLPPTLTQRCLGRHIEPALPPIDSRGYPHFIFRITLLCFSYGTIYFCLARFVLLD